ncbi:MAG TPA: hypothetical protein VD834_09030 [Blastococcus sp.]|nr:hypothetical protein [Blastococcus sp.]
MPSSTRSMDDGPHADAEPLRVLGLQPGPASDLVEHRAREVLRS